LPPAFVSRPAIPVSPANAATAAQSPATVKPGRLNRQPAAEGLIDVDRIIADDEAAGRPR
jgi:hypothetical protein